MTSTDEVYFQSLNRWIYENYELIMTYAQIVKKNMEENSYLYQQLLERERSTNLKETSSVVEPTIKKYQQKVPRKIKATEHQRAISRAYYIAHRDEILEKRRIYNLKLKSKKNLNFADRPKKS